MRRTAFIGILATSLSVPLAAYAQTPSPAPVVAPSTIAIPESLSSLTIGQWLAIGGGAIIGGVVLDLILPVRVAYLVGGVAGAYLGYTWYTQAQK